MAYLILDPAGEYPAEMIEFLGRTGRGAIAIFTNEGAYYGFQHMYADRLGSYVVDSYLLSEWGTFRQLAEAILSRWYGHLEGIIPWDETSIEIGAVLGEWLGLSWNSAETIHCFRNKFAMKDRLRAWGDVRINASSIVRSAGEVSQFLDYVHDWPVVVKPTSSSGSLGITFAWSWDELLEGCQNVTHLGGGEVLLEEYIGGSEFIIDGIVDARSDLLVTDCWFYDKINLDGARDLYYDTHKVSTHNPVFWPLAEYAGKVVERLGLRRAPIHMELKMDEYGPCLIEVGARLGGGNTAVLGSLLHGRNLFELAACHYVAEMPAATSDLNYENYDSRDARVVTGVQPHTIERVSEVHGLDIVRSLPSFQDIAFIRPPGSYLPRTTDMWSRNYEVYLFHENADQVGHDAEVVREVLHYS